DAHALAFPLCPERAFAGSRFRFSLSWSCGSISRRPNPDVALNHMRDLAVYHLTPKLGMIVGFAVEIEVLRIDRLLVDRLINLGAQVFHPVVPLRAGPVIS